MSARSSANRRSVHTEEEQSRTIMIRVPWTAKDEPPVLKINNEAVPREALDARLREIFLKRAEKVAFVQRR